MEEEKEEKGLELGRHIHVHHILHPRTLALCPTLSQNVTENSDHSLIECGSGNVPGIQCQKADNGQFKHEQQQNKFKNLMSMLV